MILDGNKIKKEIASELEEAISVLGESPHLVIIQIGENNASDIYIQKKVEFGQKIGAKITVKYFSGEESEGEILEYINQINHDNGIHGIIVQLPLPDKFDRQRIIEAVSKEKDVDGLNNSDFIPATTKGIVTLLQKNNIEINNKKVIIINDSDLVGKPTAKEFKRIGAEVVICNDETENLQEKTRDADILITAIGQPEIIDEKYLRKGQIVVDVGISKTPKGVVGDVKKELIDEDGHQLELAARTPVPGGVGPMTVASLFQNLLQAYEIQKQEAQEQMQEE
ncbi:bifunctional 5,10-methylenetetrahydrofolate dehydrogenase/5,10-methenyltetrahydrofolate cyclohydrolase [Candidatus Parcubacteria bacterium]|nr:bifunctional 5,10-methylenetetrahydrofolate dehydrogenase/5,10-methenyltetrahydrofolate cyclohydrolase [Candidatus Parcubacteria bacterium]